MNQRDLRPARDFAINVSGIYCIKNIVNNKLYIGSATSIRNRTKNHQKLLTANRHPNKHLQAAWNSCAIDFDFFIIEIVDDPAKLLEREDYWIDFYQSTINTKGYNRRLKANSNLGLKSSDETRAKISKANLGHTRNKGQKVSVEARLKISKANKGRKHSADHIAKRTAKLKGRIISDKQKEQISNTLKGNKCALGHKVSDQSKAVMSQKKRDFVKWPCPTGSKCRCINCLQTWRTDKRANYLMSKKNMVLV